MIDEKLLLEIAERYDIQVTKTEPGKGGFVLDKYGLVETQIIDRIMISFFGNINLTFGRFDEFDIDDISNIAA